MESDIGMGSGGWKGGREEGQRICQLTYKERDSVFIVFN